MSGDNNAEGEKVWYIYRSDDMNEEIRNRYGEPEVYTGDDISEDAFKGRSGIIHFYVSDWNDATGHVDVMVGGRCIDECYFGWADKVEFWEVVPEELPDPGIDKFDKGEVRYAGDIEAAPPSSRDSIVPDTGRGGARLPGLGGR